MDSISTGDLILADCYYCTYFIIALLQARGADVLLPQHQRRRTDFRTGQRLGAKDHVVTWLKPKIRPNWLSREQYDAAPDSVTVRELQDRQRVDVGLHRFSCGCRVRNRNSAIGTARGPAGAAR